MDRKDGQTWDPFRLSLLLAMGAALSGCGVFEGSRLYHGPDSVIAEDDDRGTDDGGLVEGEAAIAYDPDGCQVWIIDDGLEGYSSPRFDPKTGLPVCDDKYPPGTVIGDYQSSSSPIADRVPR
ncbi:hypothetical protein [Tabrizicola sp.]|uniref:hypothetical protein n=1 Tax=Tabrizicola sp. TaxID=2005166 RepID=UPI003F302DBA